MSVSEAQKKSAQKWDAANLDRVSIAMPKGMKDTVKAAAAAAGESMNQYIIGATERRIRTQECAGALESSDTVLTPDALKTAQEAARRAGENVQTFVSRAVVNQSQRDKLEFALKSIRTEK